LSHRVPNQRSTYDLDVSNMAVRSYAVRSAVIRSQSCIPSRFWKGRSWRKSKSAIWTRQELDAPDKDGVAGQIALNELSPKAKKMHTEPHELAKTTVGGYRDPSSEAGRMRPEFKGPITPTTASHRGLGP
jgi:hypothetical protein